MCPSKSWDFFRPGKVRGERVARDRNFATRMGCRRLSPTIVAIVAVSPPSIGLGLLAGRDLAAFERTSAGPESPKCRLAAPDIP